MQGHWYSYHAELVVMGVVFSGVYSSVYTVMFFKFTQSFQAFGRGVRNSGFCGCEIRNLFSSWFNVLSRQNRSGRTDFGKNNLPKVVPRTTFAAKICPATKIGPLANFGSPGGPILARSYLPKWPPSLLFPILHYRAIPLGTCIGSYSYS